MPAPQPVSVLLVDDEPRNVIALEAALDGADYSLVKARSGGEALKCVLSQDFAVILLDVRMPVMGGFETANLIRARKRSHSTPIIFLTAYDPAGAGIQEGYRLGGIDYIFKPFDSYILRSKVTFFVELFRKTVALEQATAEIAVHEQQVVALNGELEAQVIRRTLALAAANTELEALRAVDQAARAVAEGAAGRASALAEVSRVLVENFMDHRPMLSRVAQIASIATDAACAIYLFAKDGDGSELVPAAVEHPDAAVGAGLNRLLTSAHPLAADSPWHGLDSDFLDLHPQQDTLTVTMLARTSAIGTLSLGRFGANAAQFTDSDRRFSENLGARIGLAIENASLYEKASAAIEQRDNFLNIAAHELKTPLTSIQGYSQLLSHQLKGNPDQQSDPVRRSARVIEDRTRHLARLVEQILDVSRLVSSRMKLNRADADLVVMMRGLVAGFEHQGDPHELRLHFRKESLQAAVDLMRLTQVMANLIDNAVRYSPAGAPIDITIAELPNDSVVLSVRDRGLGIAKEHRARLFDRFHQAHALEYRSGMGLGLHISREIVLLHGGTITAAFPSHGGSRFTVQLPRTAPTPAEGAHAVSAETTAVWPNVA